jgi:2-dehydropantoate 2-reductase
MLPTPLERPMKIAIVGAGGVGGYLGGLLAVAGHEVALVARGEHLRAIREHGLSVRSVHGDFEVRPALVTDAPAEFGTAEMVVIAVKTYDTDAAAEAAQPIVGPTTTVIPLQNGVDAAARLAPHFGDRVLPGAAWIVASIERPGVIRQESQVRHFVIGEVDGRETARLEKVREAIASSGCSAETSNDIDRVLWLKLLFIASIGAPVGRILEVPESRELLRRAMAEVEAVARAKGIPLEDDATERGMVFAGKLEPAATSSMARDVAAGRRSEHDALCGMVVRCGRKHGVPTPVHEFCWIVLRTAEPAQV